MWRPVTRDERSYKDILSTSTKPIEVNVPIDVGLENGLQRGYICYFQEGKSMKTTERELEAKGVDNIAMSRFNTLSCIMSKVQGFENSN